MANTQFADGFGTRLAQARERVGLTQRELGASAGVNHSQVSRYEDGAAFPRPGVLLRLAQTVGVPIEHLRDGEPVRLVTIHEGEAGEMSVALSESEVERIMRVAGGDGVSVEAAVLRLVRSQIEAMMRAASDSTKED